MPQVEQPGLARHFIACNQHDLSKFTPFYIDQKQLGWVPEALKDTILGQKDFQIGKNGITLAPELDHFDKRSKALETIAQTISVKTGRILRKEMYPILENWDDEPLAQIDRAAVPWFGVRGFGVHVNGYVKKSNGLHLWVAKRASDRLVDPGKLDNIIGGGQPIGLSIEENLCKEAEEEAGIKASLALTAKKVRPISYKIERHQGLRNDTLFIFDLELSESDIPRNTDGEVASFQLMPLAEVAEIIHDTDQFKFNCNIVIIDFLVRHNYITTDHKDYQAITSYLK